MTDAARLTRVSQGVRVFKSRMSSVVNEVASIIIGYGTGWLLVPVTVQGG